MPKPLFKATRPFIRIRDSLLPGMIGKLIHIDGAYNPGVVFRLVSLTETHMNVETPKTKKPYSFPRWKAQYTRDNQPVDDTPPPTVAMGDPDDVLVKKIKERCANRPSYTNPVAAANAARKLASDPNNTFGSLAAFQCPYCVFWHIGRPS